MIKIKMNIWLLTEKINNLWFWKKFYILDKSERRSGGIEKDLVKTLNWETFYIVEDLEHHDWKYEYAVVKEWDEEKIVN